MSTVSTLPPKKRRRPCHGSLRQRGWAHMCARGQGDGHTVTVRDWGQIKCCVKRIRSEGKGANRQNAEKKRERTLPLATSRLGIEISHAWSIKNCNIPGTWKRQTAAFYGPVTELIFVRAKAAVRGCGTPLRHCRKPSRTAPNVNCHHPRCRRSGRTRYRLL